MSLALTTPLTENVQQEKQITHLRIMSFSVLEVLKDDGTVDIDACWAKLYMAKSLDAEKTKWERYPEPYVIRNVKTEDDKATINGFEFTLALGDHFTAAVGGTPNASVSRRDDIKAALYSAWQAMGYHAGTVE